MINDEKKYNILVVHNHYQQSGGEDTVVNNEIDMLKSHGHKIFTYFRDNNEIKKFNIIQKILLPFNYIFSIKTYRDIIEIIKKNNINIVHVHNTMFLISQSVYYAAISLNIPVVQTIHNFRFLCPNALFYRDNHICEDCVSKGLICSLNHKCYRNSFLQTLVQVINIWIHRHTGILKKVNFIVLTDFNKEKLLYLNKIYKHKLIDEKKVFVKPNFVNESIKENEIVSVQERKYYLYVGRLDEIKGIDTVLETFSKITKFELHVVGSGGENYKEKYKQSSNIKFLGTLRGNDLINEYKYANALIFASKLYEGMPMTIIESFSCGTPVIVNNIGNGANLIADYKNGFIYRGNDIFSFMNRIYTNSNGIAIYDENLRNAYSEYAIKYSKQNNYKILLNIYKHISLCQEKK